MENLSLLNTKVTNASQDEILEYIVKSIKNRAKNYYITTPNPEIIMYGQHHREFRTILNNAQIALPDGVGLRWAAHMLKIPLNHRVTGVEMVEKLCEKANENAMTVGFLGAGPQIAELAADRLKKQYPNLKIALCEAWDPTPATAQKISDTLSKGGQKGGEGQKSYKPIDILFVAYGFPKQEEFMATYCSNLPVRVMVGVGGSFDYLSGTVSRAPQWVQKIGGEWLYRLVRQPWRLKRQLALLEFIFLVIKTKLSS